MRENVQKEDELSLLEITRLLALQLGHHFITAIVHQSVNPISRYNTLIRATRDNENQNFRTWISEDGVEGGIRTPGSFRTID